MVGFGTELGARVHDHSGPEPGLLGEFPENASPTQGLRCVFKSPILLVVLTPESKSHHRRAPMLKKSEKNNIL